MYKVLLFENDKRIDETINIFSSERTQLVRLNDVKFNKEELVDEYKRLRTGKKDADQAEELVERKEVQAALLLKMGFVDGVVGGCVTSTENILFPILRLFKNEFVSSASILTKDNETLIFADTSISTSYKDYKYMTRNTIELVESLGIAPSVALLSHSTNGSSNLEEAKRIQEYAQEFKEDFITSDVQFDAAYVPAIAQTKGISLKDKPNTFIFPNLDAANIGYKIAQQLGGYKSAGPIMCGLSKPFNDLSRGSTVEDIIATIIITEKQMEGKHE